MEFILGSSNLKKVKELNSLIEGVSIISPERKIEVIEDGDSFHENALKKARAYSNEFGTPACSDDSGLVIESFPDMLGIHSARYEPDYDDRGKCLKLVEFLNKQDESKRKAHFVCVLCFYISEKEVYFFEGKVAGKIHTELLGEGGFGYDPIFIPDLLETNESFAQATEWKMKNSHRAKAAEHAKRFFLEYCQKS